jgi:hypothetical protein
MSNWKLNDNFSGKLQEQQEEKKKKKKKKISVIVIYHISLLRRGSFAAASCLYVSVSPLPHNFMSQLEDFHEIWFE